MSTGEYEGPKGRPKTLDAAIQWLLDEVPRPVLAGVAALDRIELPSLHFGFAMQVRNAILWGNPELVHQMGLFDQDSASAVIVEALWEHLRGDPAWESEIAWARKNHEVTRRSQAKARAAVRPRPLDSPHPTGSSALSSSPDQTTTRARRLEDAAAYIVACIDGGGSCSGPEVDYYLTEREDDGEPMLRRRWLSIDRVSGESDDDALRRLRSEVAYRLDNEPHGYARIIAVESGGREVWVVDIVGDAGAHDCLGPFQTRGEADAALAEEAVFDPDDVSLEDL